MAWSAIKEAIYALADAMAPEDPPVAGGYNFDWDTGRRADRGYELPTFIIEYPVNVPFETDVTREGGVSSTEWRLRRRVLFIGRVPSDMLVAVDEEVIDKNNDALDKALDDFQKMFDGTIGTTLCPLGVKKITFVSSAKRPLPSNGVYYPFELIATYDIDYTKKRG